ncbi:hypothetical protein [Pararhodobacter zhoushanensis]|uniref:Uncharacterized protein n=1 Tax=Pararhodobacter zhoushanensis TaxID=2479545 RepID=A0ABT3GVG2_9RHOB|nr:hypothetical protein [Pararhodobacter zhoushanensis]MCW1931532.1 hypothetical protein [Pararhodobacter zhoushanensis]
MWLLLGLIGVAVAAGATDLYTQADDDTGPPDDLPQEGADDTAQAQHGNLLDDAPEDAAPVADSDLGPAADDTPAEDVAVDTDPMQISRGI